MKVYIDLSNLVKVNFITGIQRVAREIVLRMFRYDIELILIVYSPERDCFVQIDNERFIRRFQGLEEDITVVTDKCIAFNQFGSGSVFFDIDSVWNSRLKRSWLFPILKEQGVQIVTQLYDIIPISHPQYCHEITTMNFINYLGANIKFADLIITSANATKVQLDEMTDRMGIERKKCVVVPLGCDFKKKDAGTEGIEEKSENIEEIAEKIAKKGKYILMVGTIEPRKNHSLVLDALDEKLADIGVNVVFAGRIGWNVAELEERINNHPKLNENLFIVKGANDETIDYLYKNAYMVAFPTFNEGFGLPIIEAFERETPVIASDIGVLHEVGGEFADYFSPYNKDELIEIIENCVNNPQIYMQKKQRVKKFVPYTWNECADDMVNHIISADRTEGKVGDIKVKQMVVLTARNQDILETLPFIDRFMSFIEELVICCPNENTSEIQAKYKGRLKLTFLTDDELLNGKQLPEDHTTRNFFLRCLAIGSPVLDDVFIMTDDDYRPLFNISQEVFLKDNKYQCYYCYDLEKWRGTYGNDSSYDKSMFRTAEFLRDNGYPSLQYSSHQPQIIEKAIYLEMLKKHDGIQLKGLDEWGTYFNYGIIKYPEKFNPLPYISMCWPGGKTDWDLYVQPSEYVFENFYSSLYDEGGIFEGFSRQYTENIVSENVKKAVIYSREMQKQAEWHKVQEAYKAEYNKLYRSYPCFALKVKNGTIEIELPEYEQFAVNSVNRIYICIENTNNSENIILQNYFSNIHGEIMTPIVENEILNGDKSAVIPIRSLPFKGDYIFNIKAIIAGSKNEEVKSIPVNII